MSDWISTSEASNLSGYHAEHIRKLIREKRVKARKFLTLWLVSRKSLLEYLKEQTVTHGEKRGRPKS
ncbi:MAG: helix-turn-helix domain-containing protein [Chloroflexi bacterium]|nr:helix-turn-helix domain-containing protein [Chloroflexota bacterium]